MPSTNDDTPHLWGLLFLTFAAIFILSNPCTDSLCRASEGSEIIDAVLLTCYEHQVLGLITAGQEAAAANSLTESADNLSAIKKRRHITPKLQSQYSMLPANDDFFPDTRVFQKEGMPKGFKKVLSTTTPESPLLSMKEHKGVKVGDVIRLFPAKQSKSGKPHPPLLLFYCGEQKLVGLSKDEVDDLTDDDPRNSKRSFFLYPYLTGVEWNTFPPRHHKKLRAHLLSHQKPESEIETSVWDRIVAFFKNLLSSSPPPESSLKDIWDKERHVRWLTTALSENHCGVFHKDRIWAVEASDNDLRYKYEVWRIDNDCNYTTLKKRFPRYRQNNLLTCLWASYSQVRLYQDYADKGEVLPQGKIRPFEIDILKKEITAPSTPQTRKSSDWFRTWLLNHQRVQKSNPNTQWPPTQPGGRQTWASADDPDLIAQLVDNKFVGYWHYACLEARKKALRIESVVSGDELRDMNPDKLFAKLKHELGKDNPVLVLTNRSHYSKFDGSLPTWRGHYFALWSPPQLTNTGQPISQGHAIVVIGVRECDGDRFVHFAFNDGHHYYSLLLDFYRVTVESGPNDAALVYGRTVRIPTEWNKSDGWPANVQSHEMTRLLRVTKSP